MPAYVPPAPAYTSAQHYVLKIKRVREERDLAASPNKKQQDLQREACGFLRKRWHDREHSELLGMFVPCPQLQLLAVVKARRGPEGGGLEGGDSRPAKLLAM